MTKPNMQKLIADENKEVFVETCNANFEAMYSNLYLLSRTAGVGDQGEGLLLGALVEFVASMAAGCGQTREEFVELVKGAIEKEFVDESEEEEEEVVKHEGMKGGLPKRPYETDERDSDDPSIIDD